MHFSVRFGASLMCLTVLLFLPAQGQRQNAKPKLFPISPRCCTKVSGARIKETVKTCFEQWEDKFSNCKIHAYIFETVSNKQFCVDPNASWLPERLRKLQNRGIFCQIL